MYNKKITVLFLCLFGLICSISGQRSDYEKIDQFIFQGKDIENYGSTIWGGNADLIRPMREYDSIRKKEVLDYVLSKYKDSIAYPTRYNIVDLLSIISTKPVRRRNFDFDGDPVWLRREFFRAAMRFADHTIVGVSVGILVNDDYSEQEKQELLRIFRRNYPFDAGLSYANYKMTELQYEGLKTKAIGLARRDNLDVDSLYKELYEQAHEKYRDEFENRVTSRGLLRMIGELNIIEIIPELELRLELKDSIEAYNVALTLARMGNRKGETYLIESSLLDILDAFYTKNQEVVYMFTRRGLQDDTEFYCNPNRYDGKFIFPKKYSTLDFLQRRIINMPNFLEGDYCNEPQYRDPEKLRKAQQWMEDNRGRYQFVE